MASRVRHSHPQARKAENTTSSILFMARLFFSFLHSVKETNDSFQFLFCGKGYGDASLACRRAGHLNLGLEEIGKFPLQRRKFLGQALCFLSVSLRRPLSMVSPLLSALTICST